MLRASKRPGMNAVAHGILVRALVDGPHTHLELQQETGLSQAVITQYLRAMKRQRLIYVCGFDKDAAGRQSIQIWRFGVDKDDVKRVKETSKARCAKYRARKRENILQSTWSGNASISQ